MSISDTYYDDTVGLLGDLIEQSGVELDGDDERYAEVGLFVANVLDATKSRDELVTILAHLMSLLLGALNEMPTHTELCMMIDEAAAEVTNGLLGLLRASAN